MCALTHTNTSRMGFIGKLAKAGHSFIGKASKVSSFIGKVSPHIANATRAASALTSNPAVQAAARDFGVHADRLQHAGQALGRASAVAGSLPGAINGIHASVAGTKRNLAALYKQAHS